jgi:IclR family pca regulon transcriptional regulator
LDANVQHRTATGGQERRVARAEEDRQEKPRSQSFVNAFARGLSVIEAFDGEGRALSLAEIAQRAKVDRAVARRLLLTLIELGYVTMEQKHFRLAPRILRLGYAYLAQSGFDALVQPFVAEASTRIGESVSVSVLDDLDSVSVVHVPSPVHKMGFLMRVGSRHPAFVMASGRVLLAGLPEDEALALLKRMARRPYTARTLTDLDALAAELRRVRAQGYALVDGELEQGLIALSVPIMNRRGRIVAALNASTSAARSDAQDFCHSVFPVLRAVADEIGRIVE